MREMTGVNEVVACLFPPLKVMLSSFQDILKLVLILDPMKVLRVVTLTAWVFER